MKNIYSTLLIVFFLVQTGAVFSQPSAKPKVIITGARFAYPLVEEWIREYKNSNPGVDVVIESRTTTDPAKYDLLLEAYEQDESFQERRNYLYIGRYAILPVANASSEFANVYGRKGLSTKQIKNIFFHDIFAEKKSEDQVQVPFTIYTRLQKAGAPFTFANYFGYEQQNIKGKAIAGADEHLIKAVLKDSTGITYASLNLIFDLNTREIKKGIVALPVDQDGDGRVTEPERNIGNVDQLIEHLEKQSVKNIPIEYLHLSIVKENPSEEALKFLQWVINNGINNLHQFGFLLPSEKRFESGKEKIEHLALKK